MDQDTTPPPQMSESVSKDYDDDDLFASALQSTSRLTLSTAPVNTGPEITQSSTTEINSSSEPVDDEIDLNDDEPVNEGPQEEPSPSQLTGATASASAIGQMAAGVASSTSSQSSSAVLPTASTSPSVITTSNNASQSDTLIEITVDEPKKQGEGYGSYVVYKVSTRTNLPYFRRPKSTVYRRFSDFRGLRDKLAVKHLTLGRIVPPAPKKDAVGTAKVKMSKEELCQDEFIEKRRLALERFLNRTASHETLRADPDFREFLELETELPRSIDSSALSGAGVRRFLSKFGDQVNTWTFRMEESDSWFEEKTNQIENLDSQLRKLQQSVDALIHHRRELCTATGAFAKASAMLGNYEEHTSLSCALVQLSETHDKVEQVYTEQYNSDFLYLSELIRDYINLIGAIKEALHQRVKVYQNWQHAQQQLMKKKEMKARSELAGRSDKAAQAVDEYNEWKGKVERGQQEFEEISTNIREELGKFEITRIHEFKANIIKYMESLLASQQQLIKHWEGFLPGAKGISA